MRELMYVWALMLGTVAVMAAFGFAVSAIANTYGSPWGGIAFVVAVTILLAAIGAFIDWQVKREFDK